LTPSHVAACAGKKEIVKQIKLESAFAVSSSSDPPIMAGTSLALEVDENQEQVLLAGQEDLAGHRASLESPIRCLEAERGGRPYIGEFLDRW
jgi:hypothetical protein